MARLIDADALIESMTKFSNATGEDMTHGIFYAHIAPTIDAVPTEFVMENCNLEFVCYALTDDGEWCSERCQYSEPQPECIHRYIDRIWRKEHDKIH